MRLATCAAMFAVALAAPGCATYLNDLDRADAHVAANEHERALALFRLNEADIDSLSHVDQTRYFYLRGMNDYRLGKPFRADARHWLALARAHEAQMAGGMKPAWKERLEEALQDLNQDVYGQGVVPDERGEDIGKDDSKKGDDVGPAEKKKGDDVGPAEEKPAKKKEKKKAADEE
jgi:hypothetical protein